MILSEILREVVYSVLQCRNGSSAIVHLSYMECERKLRFKGFNKHDFLPHEMYFARIDVSRL